MDIFNKKRIITGVLGLIIVIFEIGIIVNAYLTIKYKIEMSEDISKILNLIYSIVGTLSTIIVFNLIIIMFLIFYIKNK